MNTPPPQSGGRLNDLSSLLPSGPEESNEGPARRFGAFSGVFTPSILTILGVIMFLRLGWVVGNVGLAGALSIVFISHLITVVTGLSVASIATNRQVGAGGAYYIISRSLGAPAGASIGIPLFFAQALSVTFYVVGFSESLAPLMPWLPEKLISVTTLVLLVVLSLKSAELAIKAQYFVMVAIGVALVAMVTGSPVDAVGAIPWTNPDGAPFSEVFAIFFPAVTGIMAGVGMSGDLRNPRKDLPRGTLAAIAVGFVVYMALPVLFVSRASLETLTTSTDVAWAVSSVPQLIYVGVWGATLSSALGSILTAPRTLQALASDGLAPRLFGRGTGPANEPRVGMVLTFVLALVGVLLGNLDVIAPVLTMFFLATYGVTNLACGLERWAASPSFRPEFKVAASLSLLGAAGCFYVMSIIDLVAMVAASAFVVIIYVVTQRRDLGTTFGDARHGIWSALVRSGLQQLRRADFHPQNWRPNLIILGGDPTGRPYQLGLGSAIVQERGIVSYFHLIVGQVAELAETRRELQARIEEAMVEDFPQVFYKVDIVDELYRGVVATVQSYGVGRIDANTVMLGWTRRPDFIVRYVQMLRDLTALDRSLLVTSPPRREPHPRARPQIHIWWGGLKGNGGLMLLLAHLLTAHHRWSRAQLTLVTVVDDAEHRRQAEDSIVKILADSRLEATPRVLLRQGRSIDQMMESESGLADLAILGFRLPSVDPAEAGAFYERMESMLDHLPGTILVHSGVHFDGDPVLFDA